MLMQWGTLHCVPAPTQTKRITEGNGSRRTVCFGSFPSVVLAIRSSPPSYKQEASLSFSSYQLVMLASQLGATASNERMLTSNLAA